MSADGSAISAPCPPPAPYEATNLRPAGRFASGEHIFLKSSLLPVVLRGCKLSQSVFLSISVAVAPALAEF